MRTIKLVSLLSDIFYSCAQANVPGSDRRGNDEQVTQKPYYEEGVVYSLPRNGLKIIVDVEKTTFIPGPYAAYAKKYLGIDNVDKNEKKLVYAFGTQSDPGQIYYLDLNGFHKKKLTAKIQKYMYKVVSGFFFVFL